jgi:hypothetical protein
LDEFERDARSGAIGGRLRPRDSAVLSFAVPLLVAWSKWRRSANHRAGEKGNSVGTKTITMYVSDIDQSEIPAGQAYQLSIRHADGSTQQLDISEQNYRDLGLQSAGKTLKKRGRKPGSTTGAADAPRRRRTSKRPATA